MAHHSRLSKTLAEVLADKGALGYFIQYLQARGGFSLIKFWLDVENFRAAAGARDCADCMNSKAPGQNPERTRVCQYHCQNDKLSLSTDSGSVFESPLHSSGSTNDISVGHTYIGNQDEGQETIKNNLPLFQSYVLSSNCSESLGSLVPCAVTNSNSDLNCIDHCSSTFVNHEPSNLSKSKTDSCSSEGAVASEKPVAVSKSGTDNAFSGCAVCGEDSVSLSCSKDGTAVSLSVGSSRLTQATVDEALIIFNKYISHEATHPVRVPDVARDRVVAAICNDAGMVDAESFTELQGFIYQTMEQE